MIGISFDLCPPDWEAQLTPDRRLDVFRRSYAEWLTRCPSLTSLAFGDADVDAGGGIIVAWGETDVDDQQSKLHDRYEVGIHSFKNYHSVNTGKYTLSPLMGMRTAERILGAA